MMERFAVSQCHSEVKLGESGLAMAPPEIWEPATYYNILKSMILPLILTKSCNLDF